MILHIYFICIIAKSNAKYVFVVMNRFYTLFICLKFKACVISVLRRYMLFFKKGVKHMFLDIEKTVEKALCEHNTINNPSLDDIFALDKEIRERYDK